MQQDFTVVVERDEEGWFVASVPALKGCHTQARSLDELMLRIREAIEVSVDYDWAIAPKLVFVGIQRVTVAA